MTQLPMCGCGNNHYRCMSLYIILLKLELLYIVSDCFYIQERLVYNETSVSNYFSDK